jgi:hypothetical protein
LLELHPHATLHTGQVVTQLISTSLNAHWLHQGHHRHSSRSGQRARSLRRDDESADAVAGCAVGSTTPARLRAASVASASSNGTEHSGSSAPGGPQSGFGRATRAAAAAAAPASGAVSADAAAPRVPLGGGADEWVVVVSRSSSSSPGAGTSSPGGSHRFAARFVLGCDGAHSFVRHRIGAHFEGTSFGREQQWLVVDVESSDPALAAEWPHFSFVCDPRRPFVHCPLPGAAGARRFEFLLDPHRPADSDAQSVAGLLQSIGVDPARVRVRRSVAYAFHARSASFWGRGRIALAGDAAHCMPPFRGQGLCAGIKDAANICWRIAQACHGTAAPQSVLASYEAERKPHVAAATQLALRLGYLVTMRSWVLAALRNALCATLLCAPSPLRHFAAGKPMFVPPDCLDAGLFDFHDRGGRRRRLVAFADVRALLHANRQAEKQRALRRRQLIKEYTRTRDARGPSSPRPAAMDEETIAEETEWHTDSRRPGLTPHLLETDADIRRAAEAAADREFPLTVQVPVSYEIRRESRPDGWYKRDAASGRPVPNFPVALQSDGPFAHLVLDDVLSLTVVHLAGEGAAEECAAGPRPQLSRSFSAESDTFRRETSDSDMESLSDSSGRTRSRSDSGMSSSDEDNGNRNNDARPSRGREGLSTRWSAARTDTRSESSESVSARPVLQPVRSLRGSQIRTDLALPQDSGLPQSCAPTWVILLAPHISLPSGEFGKGTLRINGKQQRGGVSGAWTMVYDAIRALKQASPYVESVGAIQLLPPTGAEKRILNHSKIRLIDTRLNELAGGEDISLTPDAAGLDIDLADWLPSSPSVSISFPAHIVRNPTEDGEHPLIAQHWRMLGALDALGIPTDMGTAFPAYEPWFLCADVAAADTSSKLGLWFRSCDADVAIIRPDRFVFGAYKLSELPSAAQHLSLLLRGAGPSSLVLPECSRSRLSTLRIFLVRHAFLLMFAFCLIPFV